MTQPLDLDQIEARAAAATPGPWTTDGWEIYQGDGNSAPDLMAWVGETCRADDYDGSRNDAAFIAHAREDVAAMAAEIRRLRAELDSLQAHFDQAIKGFNASALEITQLRTERARTRAEGAIEALRSAAENVRLGTAVGPIPVEVRPTVDAWLCRLAEQRLTRARRDAAAGPAAVETHIVADDSSDPEHIDDCPGCEAFTLTGHRAARP
ncbi:hypothetical protein [Streptomyces sp. NPDC006739]|uniref:hypothetical protein n=1 Tax=Streptomyces sp. NPDC006739 TaxID=3364763 RepID=UPI0036C93558